MLPADLAADVGRTATVVLTAVGRVSANLREEARAVAERVDEARDQAAALNDVVDGAVAAMGDPGLQALQTPNAIPVDPARLAERVTALEARLVAVEVAISVGVGAAVPAPRRNPGDGQDGARGGGGAGSTTSAP